MTPSREDFANWQDNTITQWVMRALNACADDQRETWIASTWNGGACSKELLAELKVRADAYRAISEAGYDAFCDMLGEEPNDQ